MIYFHDKHRFIYLFIFNHSLSRENWSSSTGGYMLGNHSGVLYLDLHTSVFPASMSPASPMPSDFTMKQ